MEGEMEKDNLLFGILNPLCPFFLFDHARIRHLQIATRVVAYTRYSCYERWFTYINPCQLESSRKTSGNVKLVNRVVA